LHETDAGFISVATYKAKIEEFEDRIAKLEAQIETITQPTTLPEEVTGATEVIETPKPKSDDAQIDTDNQLPDQTGETPPSNESGENNTSTEDSAPPAKSNPSADGVLPTQVAQTNQITPSTSTTPPTNFGVNDPDVSTLETAILKEIRNNEAYTSIRHNKRGKILNKANELKQSKTPPIDNVLHMQVILALHTLKNKPSRNSIPLYNGCYNNDPSKLTELKNIIREFIGENDLIVIVATFKDAVDDHKNFKSIMTSGAVDGGDYTAFEKAIKST
jgi:hypothetical protein